MRTVFKKSRISQWESQRHHVIMKKLTDLKSKGLHFNSVSEVFCVLCQPSPLATLSPSLPIFKMETWTPNLPTCRMGYGSKEKYKRFWLKWTVKFLTAVTDTSAGGVQETYHLAHLLVGDTTHTTLNVNLKQQEFKTFSIISFSLDLP